MSGLPLPTREDVDRADARHAELVKLIAGFNETQATYAAWVRSKKLTSAQYEYWLHEHADRRAEHARELREVSRWLSANRSRAVEVATNDSALRRQVCSLLLANDALKTQVTALQGARKTPDRETYLRVLDQRAHEARYLLERLREQQGSSVLLEAGVVALSNQEVGRRMSYEEFLKDHAPSYARHIDRIIDTLTRAAGLRTSAGTP